MPRDVKLLPCWCGLAPRIRKLKRGVTIYCPDRETCARSVSGPEQLAAYEWNMRIIANVRIDRLAWMENEDAS